MKKNIESSLKRFLKGRKRITETLIVTFLITGSIGYGRAIIDSSNVPEDRIINISSEDTAYLDGMDIKVDNVVVNNNGNIKDYQEDTTPRNWDNPSSNLGNGIVVDESLIDVKINNNGLISGDLKVDTTSPSEIEITGYTVVSSGNGVKGDVGVNHGVISGNLDVTTGDAIPTSDPYPYSNSSLSSMLSGNGVNGDVGVNNGVISGTLNLTNGDSLYLGNDLMESGNGVLGSVVINNGAIRGMLGLTAGDSSTQPQAPVAYVSSSGNGVVVDEDVGANNGIIKGMLNLTTGHTNPASLFNTGNGVIGGVEVNNGTISGVVDMTLGETSTSSSPQIYTSGNGVIDGNVGVNNGRIKGINIAIENSTSPGFSVSGNGVYGDVEVNNGVINGILSLTSSAFFSYYVSGLGGSGNGIYGIIAENKGTSVGNIRRDLKKIPDFGNASNGFSGNGMAYEGDLKDNIVNSGLIAGSESAIALQKDYSHTGTITNYGILAGRKIISDGIEMIAYESGETNKDLIELKDSDGINYTNYGLEIVLGDRGDGHTNGSIISIGKGVSGTADIGGKNFTILNTALRAGDTDSYNEITTNTTYSNHIINGAGVASGALTVKDSDVTLNNSIVNGYEKAITLNGESSLVATDTIFNGGGIGTWVDVENEDGKAKSYLEYTNVIEGDGGDNSISLLGRSIVNGKVDFGAGSDTMTVSTASQVNGDLIGGEGDDTLTLGDQPYSQSKIDDEEKSTVDYENSLKIYHTINGFENINVEGSVILYETAKIENAGDIFIEKDSTLNLRIDPTEKDGNRVIGHALYNSGATVAGAFLQNDDGHTGEENDTSAGTLNLVTNGLGTGGIIAMDGVKLDEKLYIRTDSLINKAAKDSNNDIVVDTGKDLASIFATEVIPGDPDTTDPTDPEKPKVPEWLEKNHYEKLDKIYQSIVGSGDSNINALYPTVNLNDKGENAAGENLLLLLNDIFMANPYGYVAQASKETMGIFNEMVLNNPFKPFEDEWMVYGGLTFGEGDYDSSYRNHMSRNYYGFDTYNDDVSADSKVYGAYALAEYGLSEKSSAGVIVAGANSDTDISNGSKIEGDVLYLGAYGKTKMDNFKFVAGAGYQYGDYDTTRIAGNSYQSHKYEERVKTNGITAYAKAAYEYEISSKWSLEPSVSLTYSRVSQEAVDEGTAPLGIETNSKSKSYWGTETGIDLVRNIPLEKGQAHLKAGVSYLYSLKGHEADYVIGKMKGGSDFDILMPEQDKDRVKVKASYDVEYENGVVSNVGGGYIPGNDTDQYYVGIGIGFKFNSAKDLIPRVKPMPMPVLEPKKEVVTPLEIAPQKVYHVEKTTTVGGFKINSSEITPAISKELEKTSEAIQKDNQIREVKISGYTDITGPEKFNKELSLKRAANAKKELERNVGRKEITYSVEGKGSKNPKESNETLAGRIANRRVEIKY